MKSSSFFLFVTLAVFAMGCGLDMKDQPRYEPYEESPFFKDGRSERPLVEGTVARGELREDVLLNTGRQDGKLADLFPFEVTPEILARGRERFNIYCVACHDSTGAGNGIVIRRGFKPVPPSFHIERLRQAPAGHFFEVMSKGFGAMQDYAAQINVADRWAVTAYIRALQASQNIPLADLSQAEQTQLNAVKKS